MDTQHIPHLQCVIVVAVRGVLDADGGHSSTSVGDGTRNETGGPLNTSHCRSNKCWLDILDEMVVERGEGGRARAGD